MFIAVFTQETKVQYKHYASNICPLKMDLNTKDAYING